jgi:hypothetical protein
LTEFTRERQSRLVFFGDLEPAHTQIESPRIRDSERRILTEEELSKIMSMIVSNSELKIEPSKNGTYTKIL